MTLKNCIIYYTQYFTLQLIILIITHHMETLWEKTTWQTKTKVNIDKSREEFSREYKMEKLYIYNIVQNRDRRKQVCVVDLW